MSILRQFVNDPNVSLVGHVTATTVVGAAAVNDWVNVMTPFATLVAVLFSIGWYAVTLYETKTVQDAILRWKARAASKLHKVAVSVADKTVDQAKAAVVVGKAEVAQAKDTVAVAKEVQAEVGSTKA